MTRHRTFLNSAELGTDVEINTLPSQTQPDMTMSLMELLTRHTQGKEIPTFEGSYNEIYVPNPKELDLSDFESAAFENSLTIQTLQSQLTEQQQLEQQQAAARTAEADEAAAERVRRKLDRKVDRPASPPAHSNSADD